MNDTRARRARWALSNQTLQALTLMLVAALAACGCGSDNGDASTDAAGSAADAFSGPPIEIAGTWMSSFGEEIISSTSWSSSMSTAAVVEFDNDGNLAFTQNAADAQYAPGKFNKLVWTEPSGDTLYYCTVDHGLDSLEAAKATTKAADDSDPANSGCGDFGWTKLTKK